MKSATAITSARRALLLGFLSLFAGYALLAQEGFELHVHDSTTLKPGRAALELHSIYLQQDARSAANGSGLAQHGFYETAELMQGLTPWLQTSLYNFTTKQPGKPLEWTGASFRPQLRAPDRWRWPFQAAFSVDVGYQRPKFTDDTWSIEILPVLDKATPHWYFSLNPAFERSLHGPGAQTGFEFTPAGKLSYRLTPKISAGVEYFANFGRLTALRNLTDQEHMAAPVFDFYPSPLWSIEWAVGFGATHATDPLITMFIVERQFEWRQLLRR